MFFTFESFKHFENIFHPIITENVFTFNENGNIALPIYHGCDLRSKNGTNKRVDYSRGQICLYPTNKKYWKKVQKVDRRLYYTRYMSTYGLNELALNKKGQWFDWKQKKFKNKSDWFKGRHIICPK